MIDVGLIYQVESVAFDMDFKTKVTREQFERACSDLRSRFAKPIHDALASAGLNLVGCRYSLI